MLSFKIDSFFFWLSPFPALPLSTSTTPNMGAPGVVEASSPSLKTWRTEVRFNCYCLSLGIPGLDWIPFLKLFSHTLFLRKFDQIYFWRMGWRRRLHRILIFLHLSKVIVKHLKVESKLLLYFSKYQTNKKLKTKIATGETSHAIASFHFFDYFDFSNVYYYLTFITSWLSSLSNFHH